MQTMAPPLALAATGPARALVQLLQTAPAPGLPEGLHYPSQLRAIGEAAGMELEPEFSLEEYMAQTRRRLGWGPAPDAAEPDEHGHDEHGHGQGELGRDEPEKACPGPTLDDIRPAARMRDRLAAALGSDDDAACAASLSNLSSEWGLYPGLDAQCRPVTMSGPLEFLPQLAAALVPAAMEIATTGWRSRLRRCTDPRCRTPFLDGSSDGRRLYCSAPCSNRAKARRRRERDQPIG